MITNSGIELISKYLAGQAGSYASYIAVGCGARPLSNEKPVLIATSGSLGTVSGSGPYTATLTIASGVNYVEPGDVITASPGTGNLGAGVVTVTSQGSPTTLVLSSTATMTAGAGLTNIQVVGSLRSKDLSAKTKLDFEMARFPITSRSYVVEKQSVKCDVLATNSLYEIGVSTVTEHPFVKGDTISISNVNKVTYPEVNGLYIITSVTNLGFSATPAPESFLGGWTTVNNYSGFDYNNYEFTATAYSKQISLTAELSETLPYDITELGIYSLGSDQYSTTQNSRSLFNFTENENWELFDGGTGQVSALSYTSPITQPFGSTPFFASSNDSFWTADSFRAIRQEKPRFLEDALVVPGDLSDWSSTGFFLTSSKYLTISNPGIDLSNAVSTDKIVLAFSIANAATDSISTVPNQHHIMLQFMSDDGNNYAQVRFDSIGGAPIRGNRYQILERPISNIFKTSGFDWRNVSSLRIYASIQTTGEVPTNKYAFVLDGLRLESSVNNNPLYALTAYTIVNNDNAVKITKGANSKDLINFKLDLAIGQ